MFSRPPSRRELAVLHFSVFLTSFAVLTFEVTLTRIFSVTYSYHYTFLAMSISLLGLGLGGITAHLFSRKGTLENAFTDLASACLLFSLLASLLTVIAATALYANLAASMCPER